ncbi:MAG: 50S ribosomal protein L28 [Candidatus Omnitrophica bacterium]|nr:50S ribosomal protein L28 [Candidatus Omnitrophota bacterium]MCA9404469.1 50S ribosomal protein L28 [Candidatus Omnitrophota bacterium]MCB9721349.1 50S ribosomal protein L28 [Candidatus Omnitrophota bacterium]
MAKVCELCAKTAQPGNKYKRRGQIKRTGGAGSKILGKTLRRFYPNLQRVKVNDNGTIRRAHVCVSCIQKGKVTKA